MNRGKHVKHFIAFVTLGVAAIASGMALASHFSMPNSARSAAPAEEDAPYRTAGYESSSYSRSMGRMTVPSMPAMPSMPSMPRQLPDAKDAVQGAGRAFGKATDTMAYYSDRAFAPAAMKVKQSVEQAKMPTIH